MATSSMIQYLDAPGTDVGPSNRRVTERFFATGAIAIGDFVAFQVADAAVTGSDRVVKIQKSNSGGAGSKVAIGVMIGHDGTGTDAAADDLCEVVIKGYAEGANVADAAGAGVAVVPSGTAGRCQAAGTNDLVPPVAQTLEAPASDKADVFVFGIFS